MPEGVKKFQ